MSMGSGSMVVRALVIAGLVLVSGCSGAPQQPGTISATTPTVINSSPTPTETSVEAQVETAVRAYYAELAKAIATGDTTRLKRTMRSSCPCYRSAKSIDGLAVNGQWAPDARIKVVELKVHDVIAKSAAAEVSYDVSAYDLIQSGGPLVSRIPPRQDHVDLSLVFADDRWVVANVFDLEGR